MNGVWTLASMVLLVGCATTADRTRAAAAAWLSCPPGELLQKPENVFAGCGGVARCTAGYCRSTISWQQRFEVVAARFNSQFSCPPASQLITERENDYVVAGCGRNALCGLNERCSEFQDLATLLSVARASFSKETGCPASDVSVSYQADGFPSAGLRARRQLPQGRRPVHCDSDALVHRRCRAALRRLRSSRAERQHRRERQGRWLPARLPPDPSVGRGNGDGEPTDGRVPLSIRESADDLLDEPPGAPMRTSSLMALGVCFGLGIGSAVAAPREPVSLVYDASGTTCPGKEALVMAVTRRVGVNPFGAGAKEQIVVQISLRPDGSLLATLNRALNGADPGKRELTAPTADCGNLFQALELAVAMVLDPQKGIPKAPEPETVSLGSAAARDLPSTLAWRVSTGPSDTPVSRMTRLALSAERLRLETSRPNNGTLFMLLGGGGVALGGILIGLSVANNGKNSLDAPSWVFPAIGTALIVLGLASVAYGFVQRLIHREEQPVVDGRIEDIDQRLSQLDAAGAVDPGPPVPLTRPSVSGR
jgi:hypothetical protein